MLDDVGTCLKQYQTFDPTSSNLSFVLMLHARTRIVTANSVVTIDTVGLRQCSLKMAASEEAAQNIAQTSNKKHQNKKKDVGATRKPND